MPRKPPKVEIPPTVYRRRPKHRRRPERESVAPWPGGRSRAWSSTTTRSASRAATGPCSSAGSRGTSSRRRPDAACGASGASRAAWSWTSSRTPISRGYESGSRRCSGSRTSRWDSRSRPSWPAVQAAVLQLLEGRSFESFRITARRTFKVFPMPSDQINRELGALVLRHFPTRVNLTEPALTVRVDLLPGRRSCSSTAWRGPGGLPGGRVRARGGAPVGRDRLAGGGLPPAEAGLRGGVRALPLGAVPVRHLAEEGADAGGAPRAPPVRRPALAGAVRRDPAGGGARRARPAPRRGLPALHGADRRGDRPEDRRPGPGHRREPRPGRLADAREHRADHGGRRDADPPAAHRDRQGGDHPRGPRDRDLRDLHRAGPGLLHPLRAEAPRDARERWTPWRPPSCGSTSPAWWRWGRRARSRRRSASRPWRRPRPSAPGREPQHRREQERGADGAAERRAGRRRTGPRGASPSGAPPGSGLRTRSPGSSGARPRRGCTRRRSAPPRGRREAPSRARRPPAAP